MNDELNNSTYFVCGAVVLFIFFISNPRWTSVWKIIFLLLVVCADTCVLNDIRCA